MGDYSHEVIESVKLLRKKLTAAQKSNSIPRETIDKYAYTVQTDVSQIEEAIKFDLGQHKVFLEDEKNHKREFHGLPANPCLFSFQSIDDQGEVKDSVCVLIRQEDDKNIVDIFLYFPTAGVWVVGDNEVRFSTIDGEIEIFNRRQKSFWSHSLDSVTAGDIDEMAIALWIYKYIEIFSCSNVEQVVHKPPKFLNRKRVKKKKVPYQEYRTIVINNDKKENIVSDSNDGTGSRRRLHLCRGHIRRYKSGKRVWVTAHMRGHQDRGSIEHGYVVKA